MAEMIGGLNLVLLGRTGIGKSASGNTILGRQAFLSKKSSTSVTLSVAVESGTVCGRWVTVHDTPGLFNTELSDEKIQQIYAFVLQRCESGPCAFLLVIKADRYDQRYHVFNNKSKKPSDQAKLLLVNIIQTLSLRLKDTADSLSSRRIVLLGKSGVGKSASGNTILGQKVFRSKMRMSSVTSECSDVHATVSGRSVSVVDTPGFFHTHMNTEQLVTEMVRSIYLSSPGPHAFLIVIRVDDRFTEQVLQILQQIEMLFGEGVLKYSIILFTHGDLLEGESVENLIKQNCTLRDLVQQCGGRFHVFNNKDQNNREQVNDLLQKIDTMIEQNGGGHYSNQMFEDAQCFRLEEEEQRQREEEERKRQEEIERERKRIRAECEAQLERLMEERRKREEKQKETCVCS